MRALSDGKESGAPVGFPRPPVRTYVCVDWQEHPKGWLEVDGSQRPLHLQQKASWNSTGAVAVVSHKHMRWRGSVLGLWMSGLEGRFVLVLVLVLVLCLCPNQKGDTLLDFFGFLVFVSFSILGFYVERVSSPPGPPLQTPTPTPTPQQQQEARCSLRPLPECPHTHRSPP